MRTTHKRVTAWALVSALLLAFGAPSAYAEQKPIANGTYELRVTGDNSKLQLSAATRTFNRYASVEKPDFTLYGEANGSEGKFRLGEEEISGFTTNNWEINDYLSVSLSSDENAAKEYDSLTLKFKNVTAPENGKIALFSGGDSTGSALLQDGAFFVESNKALNLKDTKVTNAHKAGEIKWLLTTAGKYEITANVEGTKSGQKVTSADFTFSFTAKDEKHYDNSYVEDEDPNEDEDLDDSDSSQEDNSEAPNDGIYILENPITLNYGHVDAFYLHSKANKLQLLIREDATGRSMIRTPESVTMNLDKRYYNNKYVEEFKLPKGEKAGYTTFLTSFSPGLAANNYSTFGMKNAKIKFTKVSGPGDIALFKSAIDGTSAPMLNDNQMYLTSGTALDIFAPDHRHFQWLFSKPGTYLINAVAEADTENGEKVTSAEVTYKWVIGDPEAENTESEDDATEETPGTETPAKPETEQPGENTPAPQPAQPGKVENNPADPTVKPAVKVSHEKVLQGGKITFTATGFTPEEKVIFTIHSQPVQLPPVTADKTGTAHATWIVPTNFELGKHSIEAAGVDSKHKARQENAFSVAKAVIASPKKDSSGPTGKPTQPGAELKAKTGKTAAQKDANGTNNAAANQAQNQQNKADAAKEVNNGTNTAVTGGGATPSAKLAQTGVNQTLTIAIVALLCLNGALLYNTAQHRPARKRPKLHKVR